MKIKKRIPIICLLTFMIACFCSCEKTKSYSELLKEEEHAVNWYLSQKNVLIDIPENSDFIIGENAPFYKMDVDGYVYMQVISKGDMNDKPAIGDRIYFRFMRQDLKTLFETGSSSWIGNATDFNNSIGSTSLIYGNNVLTSTTQYGDGIQMPLKYLGYDCEVNLIVKSPEGFTSEASQCVPYLYNIRYFKPQY